MQDSVEVEKETYMRLMNMTKTELVEFAIQACVAAEVDRSNAKNAERSAMIRCVKMISAHAEEYFDKYAKIAERDGDPIGPVKVSAFDIRHAATPICKELGMTIPECLKAEA